MENKTHGTIVLGWNADGTLAFAKTFNFDSEIKTERDQALAAFSHVCDTCHNYVMGATDHILHKSQFVIESHGN